MIKMFERMLLLLFDTVDKQNKLAHTGHMSLQIEIEFKFKYLRGKTHSLFVVDFHF